VKAFQNQFDCCWPAFKSGWGSAAHFSKENCSSATYLPHFKTSEIAPCWFSKAPVQRQEIYTVAKDLNSPVFKSFQKIQNVLALNG
jgi:hypothetical protein